MNRRWQLLTLAVAALGLVASLAMLPPEPYNERTMSALAATQATIEDRTVPPFQLVTPGGEPVSSTSLEGRPVYMTFWAEWCDICKSEMPSLQRFAQTYGDQVDVLTVTIDDNPQAAYQWLAQHFPEGPAFHVMVDPGGRVANGIFGTTGVPETFVFNPSGHLVARYVGAQDFSQPAHAELVSQLRRE